MLEAVDGIAATRLFTHKADCEKLNQTELKNLSGSQMTFTARDEGRDNDALTTLKSSCPAPESLTLKVGAQVILIKTVDSDAGLVNGARGVVTRFLQTRNPSIRFNNGVERTMRLEPSRCRMAARSLPPAAATCPWLGHLGAQESGDDPRSMRALAQECLRVWADVCGALKGTLARGAQPERRRLVQVSRTSKGSSVAQGAAEGAADGVGGVLLSEIVD